MNVNWKLRPYQQDDEYGIIELRKVVFKDEDPDKENLEFWNWEFKDNFAGQAKMFVADDAGKIVGHYAVVPTAIMVNGHRRNGSIVVDVMTHPDYRFQGMFTKLGEYSLSYSGDEGIDFSYGFPIRKEVLPGHLKIGWEELMQIPVMVFPINFTEITSHYIKTPVLSKILGCIASLGYKAVSFAKGRKKLDNVNIYLNRTLHPQLDSLLQNSLSRHRIVQERTSDFLKWRLLENKFLNYEFLYAEINNELVGYIVLRKTKIMGLNCLAIVDLQFKTDVNPAVIDTCLQQTKELAKKDCALVGAMLSKNNIYYERLQRVGFLKSPFHFKFIIRSNRKDFSIENIKDADGWFLTWIDTDVM